MFYERPEMITDIMRWRPSGASALLEFELATIFAALEGDAEDSLPRASLVRQRTFSIHVAKVSRKDVRNFFVSSLMMFPSASTSDATPPR